ncbi:hypothetical protein [Paractinoplanes hotanensis]|uniref:Uncharacterized protein n=1 Tax=Paractinoplanes hotanensis TaxID=2906497 RepID=A0ABT0YE09_9ACTN|nr:hypothetical protein [Actinoplanes hotanensis]MCM4084284.1 hypothetical protein [Actinoplanes hotanensis]
MPRSRRLERLRFSTLGSRASVELRDRIITLCEERDAEGAAAARDNWLSLDDVVDLDENDDRPA